MACSDDGEIGYEADPNWKRSETYRTPSGDSDDAWTSPSYATWDNKYGALDFQKQAECGVGIVQHYVDRNTIDGEVRWTHKVSTIGYVAGAMRKESNETLYGVAACESNGTHSMKFKVTDNYGGNFDELSVTSHNIYDITADDWGEFLRKTYSCDTNNELLNFEDSVDTWNTFNNANDADVDVDYEPINDFSTVASLVFAGLSFTTIGGPAGLVIASVAGAATVYDVFFNKSTQTSTNLGDGYCNWGVKNNYSGSDGLCLQYATMEITVPANETREVDLVHEMPILDGDTTGFDVDKHIPEKHPFRLHIPANGDIPQDSPYKDDAWVEKLDECPDLDISNDSC